jgi:TrmH family RNA methyltransferase
LIVRLLMAPRSLLVWAASRDVRGQEAAAQDEGRTPGRFPMLITSRHNPVIKHLRGLRQHKLRKRSGTFLICGHRLVAEALAAGARISRVIAAPAGMGPEARAVVAEAVTRGAALLEVAPQVLSAISDLHGDHEVAAEVAQRWRSLPTAPPREGCWVALTQVRQPWSLGTIMRTCSAVGGLGVVLLGNCSDPYDPISVQASLGAVFSLHLAKASFPEFAGWARAHAYSLIGTSPSATSDYRDVRYRPPVALLMGGERVGLSPEQQQACEVMVHIPMFGRCGSHHLAVATAIVLYEMLSQAEAVRQPG